jgi:hypothetical protein
MANRHFGKLADVWKHAALVEVLEREPPSRYAETRVADSGTRLVYWYGYDEAGAQAWAHTRLAALTRTPLWCGDLLVTGSINGQVI